MSDASATSAPPRTQAEMYGDNNMGYQRPMSIIDIAFGLAVQFGLDLLQRAITSPSDRLVLLSTVEGELKQQGRLPRTTGFGGIIRLVKRIYRKEGISGFFRGVLTDTVLAVPAVFVDGLAMNLVFALLQVSMPEAIAQNLGPLEVAVLSIAATGVSVLVSTPVNAVRKTITTNYSADIVAPVKATEDDGAADGTDDAAKAPAEEGYRYGNAQECAQTIYRYGGWRAFYRGALVDPVTMCMYRGLYVAASMAVPVYYQMYHPHAIARALAVVADVATQPFEVVGRRLVMTASADADEAAANAGGEKASTDDVPAHRYRYDGVMDCVQTVCREEGWQALFTGLRCRLAMTACSMVLRAGLNAAFGGEGQE